MKGKLSNFNEMFLPTDTRNDYNFEDNIQTRARRAWLERARAERQKAESAPYGYKPAESHATVLADRATIKLAAASGYDEDTNQVKWEAQAPASQAPREPVCLLCKKPCGEAHTVFGRTAHCHEACLQAGLKAHKSGGGVVVTRKLSKALPRPIYTDEQAREIVLSAMQEYPVLRVAVADRLARMAK